MREWIYYFHFVSTIHYQFITLRSYSLVFNFQNDSMNAVKNYLMQIIPINDSSISFSSWLILLLIYWSILVHWYITNKEISSNERYNKNSITEWRIEKCLNIWSCCWNQLLQHTVGFVDEKQNNYTLLII